VVPPLPPPELFSLTLWEWRWEEDGDEYLVEDDECLLLPSEYEEEDFDPLCGEEENDEEDLDFDAEEDEDDEEYLLGVLIVSLIPLVLPLPPESPDLPLPDLSLLSLPPLPATTLGPEAGRISMPVSAEDWARRSITAEVSLSGEDDAEPPPFLNLSGEEEVEDDKKLFFSPPDPLILELLSCFRFLGFFEVLESSSERLLFIISRLEEPEEAERGCLSSPRRGMISNPADDPPPPPPPPPVDMTDFLAAADDEEDPVGAAVTVDALAADKRSWPASGMMETDGLMSACGPIMAALEEVSLFILVS